MKKVIINWTEYYPVYEAHIPNQVGIDPDSLQYAQYVFKILDETFERWERVRLEYEKMQEEMEALVETWQLHKDKERYIYTKKGE